MKTRLLILITILTALTTDAKTLIAYYSYTNNVHSIVTELQKQIDADLLRIEPAEKGLDYAANNYAIGSALIPPYARIPAARAHIPLSTR